MRHRPRCTSSDKDNPISSKCLKELEQQQAAVRSAYESLTPSKSTWLEIRTFMMKLRLQDESLSRKQLGLLESMTTRHIWELSRNPGPSLRERLEYGFPSFVVYLGASCKYLCTQEFASCKYCAPGICLNAV